MPTLTVNILNQDKTQPTPVVQDGNLFVDADFKELKFTFYSDKGKTSAVDFSAGTFSGEVLDYPGGTKLFDLTFNSPANDGVMWPQLTDTQTATVTNKTVHYFGNFVDGGGIITPYISGRLNVSKSFKAGA